MMFESRVKYSLLAGVRRQLGNPTQTPGDIKEKNE